MRLRHWIASFALLAAVGTSAAMLAGWKRSSLRAPAEGSAMEPSETVTAVVARALEHRESTTSVGTVLALRSVTLRNELPGTVRTVRLTPGDVVDEGAVLLTLDVSVEEAELRAQEAQAAMAEALLARTKLAVESRAASEMELDRARAERDVALARIERIRAVIARKTIRAPFRARVGLSDVHPGQYLNEGTVLTTLQGVDDALHVDFSVAQRVATGLRAGETIDVFSGGDVKPVAARIVAVDARVDPSTRTALVRARIERTAAGPAPGGSVRVRVPVGEAVPGVSLPVNAVRRGPAGDYVFVIETDEQGTPRAHERRIAVGTLLGDEVLVRSGVAAGEQVAAAGSFKLREGARVTVAER